MQRHCVLLLALFVMAACELIGGSEPDFRAGRLMAHIRTLSSDDFGGRGPGSEGEEKTVTYLTEAFESLELAPGNPDGTYVQEVPLVGITATEQSRLFLMGRGGNEELASGLGYIAWTKRVVEYASAAGELVFVGYGVVAPEYGWDDYKDVDVRGKILLMLVNDPPGEDIFGGDAMTYYGRWTYKFEIAAEKGAAGAFIVHETVPAGYPWEVVTGSWSGEQFDLQTDDKNMGRVAVEGWFSEEATRAFLKRAGLDFDELKQSATGRNFNPVPVSLSVRATIQNKLRRVDSANVLARIEGSEEPDETILYVAHWDHLGTSSGGEEDPIFNGAYDNATGISGLLELARAFRELDPSPGRSVLFLATTAEEQGLLGSRYYAEHPLYPRSKTVAAINMDGLNIWGPTRDVTIIGMGQSELDGLADEITARQGRVLTPDPEPEKGFYYRSDHFELAKVGIPAFYADVGVDFEGYPQGWGQEQRDQYTAEDYHKPSDEVKNWYELSGMVQDLELFYEMGRMLAEGNSWPAWSEASEFRAVREASQE